MMQEYRDNRKSSFVLYYPSTEQLLDNFNDEEVGKVFRAAARYELYGKLPPDDYFTNDAGSEDKALRMLFTSIRNELDRNYERWKSQCERNKKNRNAYKYRDEAADNNSGDEP